MIYLNVYLINFYGSHTGGKFEKWGGLIQSYGPYPNFLRGWADRKRAKLEHRCRLMNEGNMPQLCKDAGDSYQVIEEDHRGRDFPGRQAVVSQIPEEAYYADKEQLELIEPGPHCSVCGEPAVAGDTSCSREDCDGRILFS